MTLRVTTVLGSLALLAGCSSHGGAASTSATTRPASGQVRTTSTTTTTEAVTTTTAPVDGQSIWSISDPSFNGPGEPADHVVLVDDVLLVTIDYGGADGGAGGKQVELGWQVVDIATGKVLGVVRVQSEGSNGNPTAPALGKDPNGKWVLAVRRDVRVAGSGVKPGHTDQLLGLYDVATGAKRWEVDALLGDPANPDPNSTDGTRPLTPVGFAGGNLIGYSDNGIGADAPQHRFKAVKVSDGSMAWQSPMQSIQYVATDRDRVISTKASKEDGGTVDTIEIRDAKSGKITKALTLPTATSEGAFGGQITDYSEINKLLAMSDGTYIVDETIPSVDTSGSVNRHHRVEALRPDLTTMWKFDDVALEDSPGKGVIVLSTTFDNGSGFGLQGVKIATGKSLWSISRDDLSATDFSLDDSIEEWNPFETRGLVFGSARSEQTGDDVLVVIDAVSGEQVYVGTGPVDEVTTKGYWVGKVFVSLGGDGGLKGYVASKPPIGVTGTNLVYPT